MRNYLLFIFALLLVSCSVPSQSSSPNVTILQIEQLNTPDWCAKEGGYLRTTGDLECPGTCDLLRSKESWKRMCGGLVQECDCGIGR